MKSFPYTRIISYGCSFTAGDELSDHEFIGMTEDELKKFVKTHDIKGSSPLFYDVLKYSEDDVDKIKKENSTRSWPNYIAKHYGIPLINKAVSGGTNELMLHYYMQDRLNQKILPTDLILIGLTSPSRWFQFDDHGYAHYGVVGVRWKSFDATWQQQIEKNWFNIFNMMHNYMKTIRMFSHESDLNNHQIKLCHAFCFPGMIRSLLREELELNVDDMFGKNDFFDSHLKMIPNHNFLNDTTCIADLAAKGEGISHHTFGHPTIKYHKIFAELQIEELEKNYD